MPARPSFTSKLSLPARLKLNNTTNSAPSSVPNSPRTGSPRRAMTENNKPGLVLRVNVLKVRGRYPAARCPRES